MEDIFDSLNLLSFKTDLKIRPKKMWGHHMKPLKGVRPKVPLITPVKFVYSSFNTNSPNGPQRKYITNLGPRPTTLQVLQVLKGLQYQDMKMFNHNIRYNFMIGGDGVVYQGRGWRIRPDLPKRHVNNCNHSIHIGFIGCWHDEPPDEKLFELRNELFRIGVHNGAIDEKFLHVTLAFPSVYKYDFEAYVK